MTLFRWPRDLYEICDSELERTRTRLRELEGSEQRPEKLLETKALREHYREVEIERNRHLRDAIALRTNRDRLQERLEDVDVSAETILQELIDS